MTRDFLADWIGRWNRIRRLADIFQRGFALHARRHVQYVSSLRCDIAPLDDSNLEGYIALLIEHAALAPVPENMFEFLENFFDMLVRESIKAGNLFPALPREVRLDLEAKRAFDPDWKPGSPEAQDARLYTAVHAIFERLRKRDANERGATFFADALFVLEQVGKRNTHIWIDTDGNGQLDIGWEPRRVT